MSGLRPRTGRCTALRTVGRRRRARHRRRDPMTRVQTLSLAIGVALAALAVGWMAGRATNDSPIETTSAETSAAERKVLYYRNPMGLADTSPVPKKDSIDRKSTRLNSSH